MELYLYSPNTPLWRGAQLKHRDNFTLRSGIDAENEARFAGQYQEHKFVGKMKLEKSGQNYMLKSLIVLKVNVVARDLGLLLISMS
jgi:hypothetical protein